MAWAGITTHLQCSRLTAEQGGILRTQAEVWAGITTHLQCSRLTAEQGGILRTQADGLGWYSHAPSVLASYCRTTWDSQNTGRGLGWYSHAPSMLASNRRARWDSQNTGRWPGQQVTDGNGTVLSAFFVSHDIKNGLLQSATPVCHPPLPLPSHPPFCRMTTMNWYSIFSAARLLGIATVIVGVIAIVIIGAVKQTKRRIAEYKKSGRFLDLLKIFSRY